MGATGQNVDRAPLVTLDRSPGTSPVAVYRLPDRGATGHPAAAGPHRHDFLVMFYAHRAGGTVGIDGRAWSVRDGYLFVIAPGQAVSFPTEAGTAAAIVDEGWVVRFPADAVPPGAYASWRAHPLLFPFARGIDRVQRLTVPVGERGSWLGRFGDLDRELRDRPDGYHEAAVAHLTLLLVAAARLSAGVAGQLRSSDEPLLAAVFDVIEERFGEPISLADVAAAVSLTPGHVTTVLRRRTGRTVQQWLVQRRMQEARRLLTETDLTVAAVGRRVGYADVSYFIRRFRAEHRMTPVMWRDRAPGD
ncbi:hypothetical protein ACTI_64540 [Actinoplanes sp. OR16]|nr:hypothetical protein ACTI_64540 [Actinoplanes sp. OR16]